MIRSNNLTVIQWILAFNFVWSKNVGRNAHFISEFENIFNPAEYLLRSKQVLAHHQDKMMKTEKSVSNQIISMQGNNLAYTAKNHYLRHPGSKKQNKSGQLNARQRNYNMDDGRYQSIAYANLREQVAADPMLSALHLISAKATIATQQLITGYEPANNNLKINYWGDKYFALLKIKKLSLFDAIIFCLIVVTGVVIICNCLIMLNIVHQYYM